MAPRAPKTPAKRVARGREPRARNVAVKLRYDDSEAGRESAACVARDIGHLVPTPQSRPPIRHGQDIIFMVLDVVEEAGGGRFHVWGVTEDGASVLVQITDFEPYLYVAAPENSQTTPLPGAEGPQGEEGFHKLQMLLNRNIPKDSQIQRIEAVHRRPILYFRPDSPAGDTYLKLVLAPGGNARKAGNAVLKSITSGLLKHHGYTWRDSTLYEYEVAPLQRLLADIPLSAGAWVYIPGNMDVTIDSSDRLSSCDIEVIVPWRAVVCLTPDATQLADESWTPCPSSNIAKAQDPRRLEKAVEAAKNGNILGLSIMSMDVCLATYNGESRTPLPSGNDPVVAISCSVSCLSGEEITPEHGAEDGDVAMFDDKGGVGGGEEEIGLDGGDEDEASGLNPPSTAGNPSKSKSIHNSLNRNSQSTKRPICFVLSAHKGRKEMNAVQKELYDPVSQARVMFFPTESSLLLTWLSYFMAIDPDIIALFQVKDTLHAISQRFQALGLCGGALFLSRYTQHHATPISIRRVTMYSAAWVRSQSRMSSTSNQETFKADVDGRIVVDLLRHALSTCNLASFSFVDLVQSLLGETIEVLGPGQLASMCGLVADPSINSAMSTLSTLRAARYSGRRLEAVSSLLLRLSTIPEAIEMARATGLTIGQVMWNAQMIRTWSLLLRAAQREGCIIPSRPETSPLSESTFILHPVEYGTVGLHKQPVVILDFASLYPSIYRAYNLCYSTLLHPDDVKTLNPNDYIVTPTGSFFVKPEVRPGILPSILAALMSARAATRQQLKSATSPGQRAVLDSRQKALKVTANALYGFTGAQASPLQCTQLANACLAYGAQSCKKAKHVLEDLATKGELGTCGEKARVIYGHTDSLFALLPNANSVSEAVRVGHRAAELVSHTFPPPMQLKFERVCQPLMLLHVNRYAGRAFEKETEDESKEGELIVKGLRSMWRQTAPFLRFLINGVLVRVIMGNDVSGAVKFAETEIQRLLRGQVTIYELIMTGGLWRVTGEQVERAATESMESTEEGPAAASSRGVEQKEDIRGPHAALAVRLSQRDPGRSFVLGERLQYVLISGHELQDEAAEDPLEAALCGKSPDYELYWKNKLQRPLAEIFSTCLSPPQVQSLLHGQHTLMKVDNTRLSGHGPGSLGPSSPSPGKGKSKRRQLGMMEFYSARPKCLGCRRPMGGGGGNGGVTKNAIESVPALCDMCAGIDGKRQEVLLNIVHEAACLESELSAAYSACRSCQSGLAMQPVICHNAECPVTYVKIGDHANLEAVALAFKRLEL